MIGALTVPETPAADADPVPACPHCGATSVLPRQTVGVQEAADLTGYSVRQVSRLAEPERPGEPSPRLRARDGAGGRKILLADVLALRAARKDRRRAQP